MNLFNKIIYIYPSLQIEDFFGATATIQLQNDGDDKGDYIKSWTNINPKPTQSQLDAIKGF